MSTAKTPNVEIGLQEYETFRALSKKKDLSVSESIRQLIVFFNTNKGNITITEADKTPQRLPFEEYMFKLDREKINSQNYKKHLYQS